MAPEPPWNCVWITGASTGIGREMALQLAREGVQVAASARSVEKLKELAATEPRIHPVTLDVTNLPAVRKAAGYIRDTLGPIDLAVLNAGIWQPLGALGFEAERAARSMDVNYNGVIYALDAVLPHMITRGAGHVALVSSVAAYRGLPKGAAYAPSKAAVIALAEALKHDLDRLGIKISVINPGFIDTPMTKINKFPMPFLLTAEDAARRIIAGLKRGKYEIAFPWQLNLPMKLARRSPNLLYFWFMRTFIIPARNRP